jgi:hypothetical protein
VNKKHNDKNLQKKAYEVVIRYTTLLILYCNMKVLNNIVTLSMFSMSLVAIQSLVQLDKVHQ